MIYTGNNNKHIGNEQLRNLARSQVHLYSRSSKKEKSKISRQLVNHIRGLDPSGRFLKKNSLKKCWEDVGDEVAREKASQALRDAVSEWNKGSFPHHMHDVANESLRPLSPPSVPKDFYKDDDYRRQRRCSFHESNSMLSSHQHISSPSQGMSTASYRFDKRPPPVVTPDDPEHWRELYTTNSRNNAFEYGSNNEHGNNRFVHGDRFHSRQPYNSTVQRSHESNNYQNPYQHYMSQSSYSNNSARMVNIKNEDFPVKDMARSTAPSHESFGEQTHFESIYHPPNLSAVDNEKLDNFDLFQW